VEKVLHEIAQSADICSITNLDMAIEDHLDELIHFRESRRYSSVKTRILTYNTPRVQEFFRMYGMPAGDEYRYIKQADFEIQNDLIIFAGKVCILSIPIEEKHAFIIDSVPFANTQMAIFEMLWQS
jgi:hypothetical protein